MGRIALSVRAIGVLALVLIATPAMAAEPQDAFSALFAAATALAESADEVGAEYLFTAEGQQATGVSGRWHTVPLVGDRADPELSLDTTISTGASWEGDLYLAAGAGLSYDFARVFGAQLTLALDAKVVGPGWLGRWQLGDVGLSPALYVDLTGVL